MKKETYTRMWFEPQPDITASELAYIVTRTNLEKAREKGVNIFSAQLDEIPAEVRRHFRPENKDAPAS